MRAPMKKRTLSLAALPLFSLLALLAPAGVRAEAPPLPAKAERALPLAGGHWLSLNKRGVELLDARGRSRARLDLRSKQMDLRGDDNGALALVFDADRQQLVPLRIDLRKGSLTPLPPLPATAFSVETLCQYRDAQGLDQAFLVGKDGQSEQWLLSGEAPRLLRRLALPPRTEHCRVDDASHTLFVSEHGFGVWAYPAAAEGVAWRQLVAARRPHGTLPRGPGAIAPLPGGLAVLDDSGRRLHLFRQPDHTQPHTPPARQDNWQPVGTLALASAADPEQLARFRQAGAPALLLHGADGGPWRWQLLAWAGREPQAAPLPLVLPTRQSEGVAQFGDTADDPAIWVHPERPEQSMVLATNKKQGLLRYDLQGRQQQFVDSGRINNVDLRQQVLVDGQHFDLALATQRDENSLVLYTIDPASGQVAEAARLATDLRDIYGVCLYTPARGGLEVFANDKDGAFRHYRLRYRDGRFAADLLRRFALDSQPEGCVADDAAGRLFIGEEKRGIWALPADADAAAAPQLVLGVGPHLVADVEGLTLYRSPRGHYLIASSQGNNSYVVLDAAPPYRYRGAFRIGINAADGIDGTSDTDGIDVTAANLGGAFSQGLLVVQDGYKRLPDGPQNFKYVAWQDVARALGLP